MAAIRPLSRLAANFTAGLAFTQLRSRRFVVFSHTNRYYEIFLG